MEEFNDLKNFVINLKPTMLRLKNGEELTTDEKNKIINFYLEVSTLLSK
jgi:hypothetical protein